MTRLEGDAEFLQLSAGRFFGSTTRLVLGEVRLHWTTTTGKTLNRARLDPRFVYFHAPCFAAELVWDGRDVGQPTLLQHAGPDEFVRYARDFGAAVIAVPSSFVAAAAALAGAEIEEFRLPRGEVPQTGRAARRLTNALRALGAARPITRSVWGGTPSRKPSGIGWRAPCSLIWPSSSAAATSVRRPRAPG